MKEEKDILSDWKKRQKPMVPAGFFDRFFDELMEEIQAESVFLSQLKKADKPSVPVGFFDSMLTSFEANKDSFSIDDLKKGKQGDVPTDFFQDFPDQVLNNIDQTTDEKQKGRIIPMRIVTIVASVAAVFAIIFSIVNFSGSTGPEDSGIAVIEETEEEVYDTYLSYLDEGEIIDFMVENDITLEDSSSTIDLDDYFDYSGDDIEDYYLDELL